mgnify:FL=1
MLFTAPLGPEGGCMGVFALHERSEDHVGDDATRLLPILASQATIAIENAALYRRLKQHSEALEARVRERTAALEHLNAELQAAARQKGQLFAHLSHELRTPLNSILGFSELLRGDTGRSLTERQRRYVRHVHDNGTRLLRLINDILDLAKMEAGKLSLHLRPMTLAGAVDQALAVMQPQAATKHLHTARVILDDLPPVQADPVRVHQILLNLLSNAIKFTPEGGEVTVTARMLPPRETTVRAPRINDVQDPAGMATRSATVAFVEISVRDTGIGIAEADQQRLFQDFEQVGDSRHEGTGLGLSLTRRLVVLHGGQVGLESTPGAGSRFWFTLPIAVPVDTPDGSGDDVRP